MNILPCEIKNGEINFSGQKIQSHKNIKKSNFKKTQLGIRPSLLIFLITDQ